MNCQDLTYWAEVGKTLSAIFVCICIYAILALMLGKGDGND